MDFLTYANRYEWRSQVVGLIQKDPVLKLVMTALQRPIMAGSVALIVVAILASAYKKLS